MGNGDSAYEALASSDPACGGTTVDHTVSAPSLATQLTAAGKTWRGYFQSLPPVPSTGVIKTGPNANGPYTLAACTPRSTTRL